MVLSVLSVVYLFEDFLKLSDYNHAGKIDNHITIVTPKAETLLSNIFLINMFLHNIDNFI